MTFTPEVPPGYFTTFWHRDISLPLGVEQTRHQRLGVRVTERSRTCDREGDATAAGSVAWAADPPAQHTRAGGAGAEKGGLALDSPRRGVCARRQERPFQGT